MTFVRPGPDRWAERRKQTLALCPTRTEIQGGREFLVRELPPSSEGLREWMKSLGKEYDSTDGSDDETTAFPASEASDEAGFAGD